MNNPGIHGKEISENLNVSSRTIRNEITFMNDVTNCILIRSSAKQGYMINDEHLDIKQHGLHRSCSCADHYNAYWNVYILSLYGTDKNRNER